MLPNQNAPANRRPALRSIVMDNLNINVTHHIRGLAVAELCRLGSLNTEKEDKMSAPYERTATFFFISASLLFLTAVSEVHAYHWRL
jgi:hypothetical protein